LADKNGLKRDTSIADEAAILPWRQTLADLNCIIGVGSGGITNFNER
jgi:hypothetical protein